jgi:glycosyltransferase involved in cell wall biosynthesis
MAIEIARLLNQPGVKDLGKIGQQKLSQYQMNADAWLYPFDPIQPTETGCITAIENAAAGNPLITTDGDCMEDEFGDVAAIVSLPFDVDHFVDAIRDVMKNEELYRGMQERGLSLAKNRDWSLIAPKWIDLFRKEVLNA